MNTVVKAEARKKEIEVTEDTIAARLTDGRTISEILRNYPGLTQADIQACLAYTSATLRAEKVYPVS
jgi:uncharacterized protein (DUF433 family)